MWIATAARAASKSVAFQAWFCTCWFGSTLFWLHLHADFFCITWTIKCNGILLFTLLSLRAQSVSVDFGCTVYTGYTVTPATHRLHRLHTGYTIYTIFTGYTSVLPQRISITTAANVTSVSVYLPGDALLSHSILPSHLILYVYLCCVEFLLRCIIFLGVFWAFERCFFPCFARFVVRSFFLNCVCEFSFNLYV